MILQDLTTIWVTTHYTIPVDGEMQDYYIGLHTQLVNLQAMPEEIQMKTYGEVQSGVVVLRTDDVPDIYKTDHIYLQQPESLGMIELEGTACAHYPPGAYAIASVKPSYIGGTHVRNPTTLTAEAVVP